MRYRRVMPVVLKAVVMTALLYTAGCSSCKRLVYRSDVNQGNYLDQTSLQQLKRGMTKEQVSFLLGTPVVSDPFNEGNTWVYVFRQQIGHNVATQKNLKLTFDAQARLDIIESDFPLNKVSIQKNDATPVN